MFIADVSSMIDAVGSVAFHPLHSLLLSVSGSRHFGPPSPPVFQSPSSLGSPSNLGDSEDESDNDLEDDENVSTVKRGIPAPRPFVLDASMKMWLFDDGKQEGPQETP